MKRPSLTILFALLISFPITTSSYSQDFGRYGFSVNVPCALEKDKQLNSDEARSVGYDGVRLWITFSCLTSTGERGEGTLYRVTYILHDVEVDMNLETYARGVCERKKSQGMKTKMVSYNGRPSCSTRDQAYIRDKVFDSGTIDFASGKKSYTLQVLTSSGPLMDKIDVIKKSFRLD